MVSILFFCFSMFYVFIILYACHCFVRLILGMIGVTQALCPRGYVYELSDCHPLKVGKVLIAY